jgi:rare lipoprotein A
MNRLLLIGFLFTCNSLFADDTTKTVAAKPKVLYGTASFYSNSFNGKKTANGEIFSQQKMTAACNVLPLGTWIRVTNLRNGRSVLVKINDRLHTRMTRVVDLSRSAAEKLSFIRSGLTRVKVEVIGKKKPEK